MSWLAPSFYRQPFTRYLHTRQSQKLATEPVKINLAMQRGEIPLRPAFCLLALDAPERSGVLMFENDYPLLSMASLVALIMHKAETEPVTLESCEAALVALFKQANETPALPPEELRERLSSHLRDLEIARILVHGGDGAWHLTDRGRRALAIHPEGLDQSDLVKYQEFASHLRETAHHARGMDPRAESYNLGYQARRSGQGLTANPYEFDSVDHTSWENGWMEAADEEK